MDILDEKLLLLATDLLNFIKEEAAKLDMPNKEIERLIKDLL